LPVAILRSSIAADVEGGMSRCVRDLLRSALFEPSGLARAGVAVKLDPPALIKVRVSAILGDEAALKAVWGSKGASGTRPCLFCGNLVSMQSGLADGNPAFVDLACTDPSRFQLCADADVWAAFDDLRAKSRRMAKAVFAAEQQAAGKALSFQPPHKHNHG